MQLTMEYAVRIKIIVALVFFGLLLQYNAFLDSVKWSKRHIIVGAVQKLQLRL